MKKVLSLLLAVLMVFTLLPVSALADGEMTGTVESTTEAETTPVPEETPEPEETPTPESTPEPEETPTPENTPEPEEQTKYPWEDMTDEEFAAYIYAEENREYLISLMTGADEAAYISLVDRLERVEDIELYTQLAEYLSAMTGEQNISTCAMGSVSSRDDGVWLWPMENTGSYNQISDWAGCPGSYSCPFHGYACGYGDDVHNRDGKSGHGHNGIDIFSSGYVRAAATGMVYSHNSLDTDRGRYVVIEHPIGTDSSGASWSYYSVYQHLASIVSPLSGRISAGTRIGYSGGSGQWDGAYTVHLHFEVVMDYSGKGQTFANSPSALGSSQMAGWVTSSGFRVGEIVENPSERNYSESGTFTSGKTPSGGGTGIYPHQGSITYTFDTNKVTVGTTPVVNTKKITFDCQGGSAETYTEEMSFAGVNCERGENSIIYNISGATVDTNTYGREIAIDATGKVVSIRDYGDETRISVPENGLVVSQHAEAGGFCWAVQIGNYVGVDYTSSKAYLYTSVDGYLLNHKTVAVGGQYGVLPTPKRETYTFDGWYTAASGGTKITAGSTYSVDKLYAHWTSNDPCASGHSWNSGTVTTAATCEKAGIKTYTCTVCKTTKTETIAALGHNYKETKIAGSCTQRPGTKYDCTRCGNSYTAWDEASWSSWSTEKPSGYTGGDIESATQYRYRDKDTTTSSSVSMTGWTLSGSEKVWGDYGTWSDWTTEAVSAGDSTQVETAPLYRYYYFLCSKCGDHNPFSGNCGCGGTSNDWHERYSTISYSQSISTVVSYASSKRQTTSLGDGELWYFSSGNLNATAIGTTDADGNSAVIRQGYRYRTRTQNTVYHFYRWGDWSSWSLTKATATGSRVVETRTVYRYNLYAKGQHKWDSGVVTTPAKPGIEGVKTYTCTACKQTRTEVIPALPITYTVSYDANGGSSAPAAQTKTKDVALTLSSTKPTRTGYKFLGWAASKTATSAQYQPGGSYTANAAVTLYAVWKTNDYTVSYDANGGTGAPAAQTKTHGTALTLSSTKPTRTGYMFLGWAASKTATSAQYQPGGSYTANAAVTLYAVWKENAPTYATTLTVSSATASQGKEVSLNVSLAGNPGIIGINFQITYDKTRLKLIGYADGAMKDWSVGIGESEKAIWIDEAADVINGNILTLKFQVLDNAPDGLAEVTVTGFKAAALDESAVNANIVAGGVTVTSRIPGDVNDDGEVDIFDCVRLKKYLAGFNVTINASNADVNGDGEVDIFDCVRLKKYLAGMSVELK